MFNMLWKRRRASEARGKQGARKISQGFESLERRELMAAVPIAREANKVPALIGPALVDGNDSTSGAINKGTFGGGTATARGTGSVGSSGDLQDYYKFALTASNHVVIKLSGLTADLDIELRKNGQVLSSGRNFGTTAESIDTVLSSGTYFVRVFKGASTANSPYTLDLRFGDDSFADAVRFGTLSNSSGPRTFSGRISGTDSRDYYSFNVNSNLQTSANIQLTGLTADLDFELLNTQGQRIGTAGTKPGTASENRSYRLSNGTYYVRVFKGVSTASSDYSLKITLTQGIFG